MCLMGLFIFVYGEDLCAVLLLYFKVHGSTKVILEVIFLSCLHLSKWWLQGCDQMIYQSSKKDMLTH